MKGLRLTILLAVLAVVSAIVIWRVYVYTPAAKLSGKPGETEKVSEPNEQQQAEQKSEEEKAEEPNEPNEPAEPNKAVEPNKPGEPNESMETVNLKDVEMKQIIEKLADWTGKVIIPTDEAMKQKITIYSKKKLPRKKALSLIYKALKTKGIVAEYTDDTIYLKPLMKAKFLSVPTIPAERPLATIENREQVVQKFFMMRNYSPSDMADVIVPLVNEYGYVSADEKTGKLLVIDTVENLIRVSRVIAQFDIPEAEQAMTEIFEIREGDPGEIVQILRILLGEQPGKSQRPQQRRERNRRERRSGDRKEKGKNGGAATSVVVGPSGVPVVLIPEPRRKWIIAKASPEDMEDIRKWIAKLDRKEPIMSEYETVPIAYADIEEVAERLNEMLRNMPGTELQRSVLVQPLEHARQIVIYGRKDIRQMVKNIILEIDIPTGEFEEKTFELEYADPEQIKKNIDELYGSSPPSGGSWAASYYYYRYQYRNRGPGDIVKVIAFPTMQQITVIANPENMRKIEVQVKNWDVPIEAEKVKPLIITLRNTDPVEMANLLSALFTEESRALGWFERYFGGRSKKKIVGPLYGQLTFEDVPGTKKIVVISKIPEAYRVVEEFVRELDKQEMAEVPRVVTLKYANPEDLAIRLNAVFNEPGTLAPIYLSESGLSEYSMEKSEQSSNNNSEQKQAGKSEYKPWWSGARRRLDEMPISNVIGRIRFIPDPRTKAILVLSPPEFIDRIEEMINELDVPGKQVRIKAIVLEISHRDSTSLGVQISSNPASFGTLDEDAITALTQLTLLEEHGSFRLDSTMNITALVDFLVKRTNARILNQQTLWTKDNEEADFFKGQKVAFTTDLSVSDTGGRVTSGFEFQRVGMTLRVRPSITPEKNVDMTINLLISQRTQEDVGGQPVRTEMDTQTTMIVKDGETIMLGGMLFQEDSQIKRKIPLFGDLPLFGGLFRHDEMVKTNSEMLVFVTPYVIEEDPSKMLPETREQIEKEREKLKSVLEGLKATVEGS